MLIWLITIMTAVSTSVITCALMEAYYTRRATEWVTQWEYDDRAPVVYDEHNEEVW